MIALGWCGGVKEVEIPEEMRVSVRLIIAISFLIYKYLDGGGV